MDSWSGIPKHIAVIYCTLRERLVQTETALHVLIVHAILCISVSVWWFW